MASTVELDVSDSRLTHTTDDASTLEDKEWQEILLGL